MAETWKQRNRAHVNAYARERYRRIREHDLGLRRKKKGVAYAATRPRPELCECCGRPESRKDRTGLSFDHDHGTGAFRGWLCTDCNIAIGKLGDTLDGVLRAVTYLKGRGG